MIDFNKLKKDAKQQAQPAAKPRLIKAVPKQETEEEYNPRQSLVLRGNFDIPGWIKYFKPDAKVGVYTKAYDKKPTALRILPALNPRPDPAANGEDVFLPMRCGDSDFDLNKFVVQYRVASCGEGNRSVSWIMGRAQDDERSNPYNILFWALKNAKKNHTLRGSQAEWLYLLDGANGQRATLTPPQMATFMQCLIFDRDGTPQVTRENGNMPYGLQDKDEEQNIPILILRGSAGESFFTALNEKVVGKNGNEVYKHKDITSLSKGKYVVISAPSDHYFATPEEEEEYNSLDKDSFARKRYRISIVKDYDYNPKRPLPATDLTPHMQAIYEKMQWWSEIIHVPTHEEQALYTAQALCDVPDLLLWAWADYGDFLTSEVRSILRKAKVVAVSPPSEEEEDDYDPENDLPPVRGLSRQTDDEDEDDDNPFEEEDDDNAEVESETEDEESEDEESSDDPFEEDDEAEASTAEEEEVAEEDEIIEEEEVVEEEEERGLQVGDMVQFVRAGKNEIGEVTQLVEDETKAVIRANSDKKLVKVALEKLSYYQMETPKSKSTKMAVPADLPDGTEDELEEVNARNRSAMEAALEASRKRAAVAKSVEPPKPPKPPKRQGK